MHVGVGIPILDVGVRHLPLIHDLPARFPLGPRGTVLLESRQLDGARYDRPFLRKRCLPLHGERKQRDDDTEGAEGDDQRRQFGIDKSLRDNSLICCSPIAEPNTIASTITVPIPRQPHRPFGRSRSSTASFGCSGL